MKRILNYLGLRGGRTHNKLIAECYDKSADRDAMTPFNKRKWQVVIKLLERDCNYERLLDIGCGPGTMTADLLTKSSEVWGIDIGKKVIEIANERFSKEDFKDRVYFEVGDVTDLRFPDEYFDAILCIGGILGYLKTRSRQQLALKQMYRVLKPGGVVIITFPSVFSPYNITYSIYAFLSPLILTLKRRSLKDCFLTYKSKLTGVSIRKFDKIIREIGFKKIEAIYFGFVFFPLYPYFHDFSMDLSQKLDSLLPNSNSLGRLVRKLLAWVYIVKIMK